MISRRNNEKYIIDLTYKGQDYLNEIYNEQGILKQPISGFVNPISGLYPVDYDLNGVSKDVDSLRKKIMKEEY